MVAILGSNFLVCHFFRLAPQLTTYAVSLGLSSIKWKGDTPPGSREEFRTILVKGLSRAGVTHGRGCRWVGFHVLGFSARLVLGGPEYRPRARRLSVAGSRPLLAGPGGPYRFRTLPPPAGFWLALQSRTPSFDTHKAAGGSWPCMDRETFWRAGNVAGESSTKRFS